MQDNNAHDRITEHEKLCAVRYEGITNDMADMKKQLQTIAEPIKVWAAFQTANKFIVSMGHLLLSIAAAMAVWKLGLISLITGHQQL